MPEPGQPLRTVRFGAFEADLQSGELRKHGLKLRLQDQPFQILAMLLERRGEMVTREELHQRLWPTDTFVGFDHGLNNAINRLREALGDTADSPHFIETLPRRGYRFIAKVDGAAPRASAPTVATSPTEPGPAATPERAARPPARIGSLPLLARLWLPLSALTLGLATLLLVNPGRLRQRLFGAAGPVRIQSIAVLPLENLTGDPSQEYFVDGMTDAVITNLAQIRALRVISRTSTMPYKGSKKPLPEIARELNVDAVVEGVVVRSGERVRIDAQLIEASTDRHLWARSYERNLHDIVAMQGEVARAIVQEIHISVTPPERARLERNNPVNPDVYEDYLRGRSYLYQNTPDGIDKAISYFQQAIEKDPTYALAYSGLSKSYTSAAHMGDIPPREAVSKGIAAARKALELDESLGEPHAQLASIESRVDWDWVGAEQEFQRALALSPNDAQLYREYAFHLRNANRYQESIAAAERAVVLDPLSSRSHHVLGGMCLSARQYDRAIQELRKALATNPGSHWSLGIAYEYAGQPGEALSELQQAVAISPRGSLELAALAHAYAHFNRPQEARRILTKMEQRSSREYVTPYAIAMVWIGLGDKKRALASLEKAYEERSFSLVTINCFPQWDPLRSDPRFQDLVRRIGLDPNQAIPR